MSNTGSTEVQHAPIEDSFRELERKRTRGLVARDRGAIERLHATDCQFITPFGAVYSRERYLALLAAEPFYVGWECGPCRGGARQRRRLFVLPRR
ncbi:MAG TPA: hypothetical protein DEH78_06160 [Solibacterales bacterium]|nr:hypothetical protein [Bryobacterales bacterium]